MQPRFRVVLACFLATLTAYVERTGFSIAYTSMAKAADIDEAVKGTVMSAFYWGYGISQVCMQDTRVDAVCTAPALRHACRCTR